MAEARTRNATDLPEGSKITELGPLAEEWRVMQLGSTEVGSQIRGG